MTVGVTLFLRLAATALAAAIALIKRRVTGPENRKTPGVAGKL
jgi:hypothetical protein